MKKWLLIGSVLLMGCGEGSTEPEPEIPADVRVTTAASQVAAASTNVTVGLENRGGPGVFKVQMMGHSASVPCIFDAGVERCPTALVLGETEGAQVAARWQESATWTIAGRWTVRRIVVMTRDNGSIQYRETDRYEIR